MNFSGLRAVSRYAQVLVLIFGPTLMAQANGNVSGSESAPKFSEQQIFTASLNARSVKMADLNGDGKPDMIVLNAGDQVSLDGGPPPIGNTVSVQLNTTVPGAAVPTFAEKQDFLTGSFPQSVVVADINGDGMPDLAVANADDGTVSVLLNTTVPGASTLSFAAQQTFAIGSGSFSLAVADINGDGWPDLIAANYSDGTVSVLLNTTASAAAVPGFTAQQIFATGSFPAGYPNFVTAADINSDGKPDLVVLNSAVSTVSVLLNTTAPGAATSSFAVEQDFATGDSWPTDNVAAADLDGDGRPDLVVTNWHDLTVSVLLNTTASGATTPSFLAQQTQFFPTGSTPLFVTAADLNNDGRSDLIVTTCDASSMASCPGNISVMLNNTVAGSAVLDFSVPQAFAAGEYPTSVTIADVNGDGMLDLVAVNSGSLANVTGSVSVLLNAAALDFSPLTSVPLSVEESSDTITVSGLDGASTISIHGGSYSINGGAYTTADGIVNNGDSVTVQLSSASTPSTTSTATLKIGNLSGAFSVTTVPTASNLNSTNTARSASDAGSGGGALSPWLLACLGLLAILRHRSGRSVTI